MKPHEKEELAKIRKAEEERRRLAKERQKKDVEKYKERVVDEGAEFIVNVLYEQVGPIGPYQCPYCKADPFETREELEAHIKKQHPKAVEATLQKIAEFVLRIEGRQRQQNDRRRRLAIIRMRRERTQLQKA